MLEVMGLGSLATENAVNAAIGAIRDLLNGAVDFRLLLSQAAPYSNRKKAPEMIRKNASLGPRAGWVGSALAVLLLAGTAQGKIEGVSYTLTPSVEMQNAPEELGLEDTTLWGGKLSLNFGRFVGLESHYFTRNGVATSLGSTSLLDSLGMPLSDQKIDMRSYGSGLVFHLASGRTVPFLKLGGGVLELRGDDGETAKQIELRAGGGIKFGFERVQARIYVEDAMVRLDRYALAASDSGEVFPADPDARKLRHRLVLGAGIDIGLGGYTGVELTDTDRAIVERYRTGLRGVSVPIEPFAGRLSFADEVGLSNQEFVGIRAGLDFGPYFGVRGYFWQGVESDFKATDPLRSFGGEAQMQLNAGQGGVPYLVVGAGKLDFQDLRDGNGLERNDKTTLILGGGIGFTLGDRVTVDVSARDYIFSQEDLESLSSANQLANNWALQFGIRLAIGGGHGFVPRPAPVVEVEAPTSTEAGGPEAGVRETEVAATKGEASAPATQPDSATTPDSTASGPASGSVATISRGSFHGGETLTIPVPTEGEIYIRYGNPGGVQIESYFEGGNPVAVADSAGATSTSAAVTGGTAIETPGSVPAPAAAADSASSAPDTVSVGAAPASAPTNSVDPDTVRQWVRDELASSPPAPAPALTDEQVAEIERRLEARLAERMDALEARTPTSVPPSAPVAESPISREVSASSAPKSGGLDWRPDALRPYAGFGADDPNQFVLGAALDLLEVPGVPALRFGPELSLGFGESITTFLLAIDARYEVFELAQRNWTPYASLGGGVLIASGGGESSERGVLNVTWGLAARLGGMKVFAEHQGVDLFDWNRLAVGVERSLP